jgi:predicted GNAT superfamily acetyltransferase
MEEFRGAAGIFNAVWGTGPANAQMPPELMRALTHAGGYAAGAFAGGEMIGAVVGFLGRDGGGWHLHSHILGVHRSRRTRGVGYALKQHQRAWALAQGLDRVVWTFDPLVRRNAYFNIQKLGASPVAYLADFYGGMTDGVNAGDESDRLLVSWDLRSHRSTTAAEAGLAEPDVEDLIAAGAVALRAAEDGRPVSSVVDEPTVLCATPHNIIALRRERMDVALEWRRALRSTLGGAMGAGYAVTGFTRSGWYVVSWDGGAA